MKNALKKNMKLLIDANVLLDVLQKRELYYENSINIWKICEMRKADGYISSLTFSNIVYVMRKELTPEKIENLAFSLSKIFKFADLGLIDIIKAAQMRWPDFEDALQSASAERINADYIITRNVKDFEKSLIKALMPEEFLNLKI